MAEAIGRSRALWNRDALDLRSDEVLAQVLDRGEVAAWRDLYRMARADGELRARIHRIVLATPMALPHFWLATLGSLGHAVDFSAPVPDYYETTAV